MALNIKNEETQKLAHELARLQGVTLVAAVTNALKEKLRQEKANKEAGSGGIGLAERIMAISRETAPLMNDGRTSQELLDDLYDEETGLPK